jgi:hypothetical protein
MASIEMVKTTVEIADSLLERAKRYGRRTGRPVRALIEEGLRLVLREELEREPYRMPDCSVGDPTQRDPLEELSWQDLREHIYGGR